MKNPNGYGSVVKLSGTRREPYLAKKTIGVKANGQPIAFPLKCFATQPEANIFLAEYNVEVGKEDSGLCILKKDISRAIDTVKKLLNDKIEIASTIFKDLDLSLSKDTSVSPKSSNYNNNAITNAATNILDENGIEHDNEDRSNWTLKQVYEDYSAKNYPTKEEIKIADETGEKIKGKISGGLMHSLKSAYNYLETLYDVAYKNITTDDYQDILDNCDKSNGVISSIKNLMQKLDKHASKLNIIEKKVSGDLEVEYNKQLRKPKIPFTNKEIQKFWEQDGILWADMVLFLLYTALRITEMFKIETVNVHLDENYMVGGIKTSAGKNRTIPIHPAIKHIVERYYNPNNKYLFMYNGKRITKGTFYMFYQQLINDIGIEYKVPHTTRLTARTEMSRQGGSKIFIDTILGHVTRDVGEQIYTYEWFNDLMETIKLIKYDIEDEQIYIIPNKPAIKKNTDIVQQAIDKNVEKNIAFEQNIKSINYSRRMFNRMEKANRQLPTMKEKDVILTISFYKGILSELSQNEFFIACKDSISKMDKYYYDTYVFPNINKKTVIDTLKELSENIYTYKQVNKVLSFIIYYDCLLTFYGKQLKSNDLLTCQIYFNVIIEYFNSKFNKPLFINNYIQLYYYIKDSYNLDNLVTDYKFEEKDDKLVSPDKAVWIFVSKKNFKRRVEDMSFQTKDGNFNLWLKKFEKQGIVERKPVAWYK